MWRASGSQQCKPTSFIGSSWGRKKTKLKDFWGTSSGSSCSMLHRFAWRRSLRATLIGLCGRYKLAASVVISSWRQMMLTTFKFLSILKGSVLEWVVAKFAAHILPSSSHGYARSSHPKKIYKTQTSCKRQSRHRSKKNLKILRRGMKRCQMLNCGQPIASALGTSTCCRSSRQLKL